MKINRMDGQTTVLAETRLLGGARSEITVRVPTTGVTVAQLVRAKIAAEWEAGAPVGRESVPLEAPAALWTTLSDAIRNALDGYRAGWYVVQINGEQPGGLDTAYTLTADSKVSFIRLYPLQDV